MSLRPKPGPTLIDDTGDVARAALPRRNPSLLARQRLAARSNRFRKVLARYWMLYLMLIPGVIYYIVFRYIPMVGLVMAFQDYKITAGVFGSPWVGFKHF